VHNATKATAARWIEQTLETDEKKQGSKFNKLLNTHPPLEDRNQRLQEDVTRNPIGWPPVPRSRVPNI